MLQIDNVAVDVFRTEASRRLYSYRFVEQQIITTSKVKNPLR